MTLPRIVMIALLALALAPMPIGYYRLLRIAVCGLSVLSAVKTRSAAWRWIWAAVALVFNPLFPLYLGRDLWRIVDGVAILVVLGSIRDKSDARARSTSK